MSIWADLNSQYYKTRDWLNARARAYKVTFGSRPEQSAVLADLAKFCRANTTCFHADPRLHAVAEGRREVWLRIQNHLQLTPDQLMQLYADPSLTLRQEE